MPAYVHTLIVKVLTDYDDGPPPIVVAQGVAHVVRIDRTGMPVQVSRGDAQQMLRGRGTGS